MKPLVRWTFGNVLSEEGYDCLKLSILSWKRIYHDQFDYLICYNNSNETLLKNAACGVQTYKQSWNDCPIPYKTVTNGGSMWKYCPSRLAIDRHEIVIDNDIIFKQKIQNIDKFLDSNKVMMCEGVYKYHGRYASLFEKNERLNAGLLGLPPGFDLAFELRQAWKEHDQYDNLTEADEQGLVTSIFKNKDFILIPLADMAIVHNWGFCLEIVYDPIQDINIPRPVPIHYRRDSYKAYHFVRLNSYGHHHKCYREYLGGQFL